MKCLNYWSQVRFQTDFDKENSDGEIFFDLLGGDGVYWYMFAMAAFMVLCYLLRNSRPWAVLTTAMVTALAAGYDPSVGDEYELSRIVVFFPFYYCGYVLDPEKVADFVKVVCKGAVLGSDRHLDLFMLWKNKACLPAENASYGKKLLFFHI